MTGELSEDNQLGTIHTVEFIDKDAFDALQVDNEF